MQKLFRLGILGAVFGGVAFGVWWFLVAGQAARLARELAELQAEMTTRLAERDAMIERLSRSSRKGVIEILDQTTDAAGAVLDTTVRFIELDDDGRELGSTTAKVPGDTIFVDAWVAKFDPMLVAEGDPLRGKSLILLRRLYSERMPAIEGIPIDTPGAVPHGYAIGELAQFETRLWKSFWELAGDADLARSFGVRVAQGEAVYKPVRRGDRYELTVEASGGMSLVPMARGQAPHAGEPSG